MSPTPALHTSAPPFFQTPTMSAVYLSSVQSASKLDSYTGRPLAENDLGATKSTPLLLDGSSRKNSPLLDKVLRGKGLEDGGSCLQELGGAAQGGEEEGEEEEEGRTSSFADILESRDAERDQAWTETQKSTFTNWLNDRLKSGRTPKVQDISTDLRDGTLLIKLLENLTKKKIKGYTKNPKIQAQSLVNLDLALDFIKKEGIKLIGIGSLNIFEGNLKLTLGLIWMLIQKYQLRIQGHKLSTKEVMLQWLQALLPTWNITNFTSDWTDGRALIAVINTVKPGIAPSVTTLDPTKHRNNCTLAIKVADIHLKVPKIVSADDLSCSNIDERSMMTYLSYFVEPARAKLLKWVRRALPHMGISNFTADWFDGKSFSALVNSSFPGTLPQWMKITCENSEDSIIDLYRVCDVKLGIVPHFTIDDLMNGKVEELQIMTTVMQIRNSELKSLPEAVLVSGPGLEQGSMGKEALFFIDTTEAGPGKLFIDAVYEEDGKRVKFKLEEKISAVLTLSYMPEKLGTIIFDILWSDVPVLNNPFRVPIVDSNMVQILDFNHHSKLREVGKVIEMRLNTKQSGSASLSAHLLYDEGPKVKAKLTALECFVTKLEYTPPAAGKPVLHIFMNDNELTHLSVAYTVVDVGGYEVSELPKHEVYQTFEEVSFAVKSSKNLPLDVLQMTAVLTSDIQIPIKYKSVEGDNGTASFKPTLPGVYSIEVVCVDKLIQGSPFRVQVSDPLSCKLHGTTPSFLELKKPHVFKLDTKEAGVGSMKFECVDKDTSVFFETSFKDDDSDYFKKLEVRPHVEGEYLVGIKYHKEWIPGSPFRVQVCDPGKFEVTGDLVEKKLDVVGKPVRFKIASKFEINEDFKPIAKASGPSAKYTPKVRIGDDRCSLNVTFTPHETGTHEVSVTYGGFHIPSSPFLMAVIDFDSNSCSATGSGLQEAFTNIPAQFVVLTKTPGLVEDGTLRVNVTGVLNKVECRVRVRDNQNGLYNVAYIITKPGAYLVSVIAGGSHIAGSPFKLHAQPGPEPEKCNVYGPALEEGAVLSIGKPIDFFVDTANGGTGKLTVKAVGPGGVQARVFMAKGRKGLYDIKIDPVRHGKYRVNVKWSDQHIPGSPFVLKIFPGVDASKCKAYGPGLENGNVGIATSFTIETRDAGPGTLKVCLHRVKDAFKIDLKPKDPKDVRTLIARYFPRKPGDYLISIMWSEKHIPGSPFKVRITGEAMEDDFRPNKYKPTPRVEELQVIDEEEEEDEFEDDDTDFDVASVISRAPSEDSRPLGTKFRSSTSLDEFKLPTFNTSASRKGYNETFVSNKKRVFRDSKALSKLEPEKMMTFSSMQQLGKHKRAVTSPGRVGGGRGKKGGEFHGQATLHMKSKHDRSSSH